MANVLVIGASGQIGKQATVKLLDTGHKVVAPVRSPDKLSDIQNANLTVVEQDLEKIFQHTLKVWTLRIHSRFRR